MNSFVSVAGYEGIYEINRFGAVRSMLRTITRRDGTVQTFQPKTLSQYPNEHGYLCVRLRHDSAGKSGNARVHRLLAIAFIPNPDNKPEVNHIDGNKANYSISNLEWATDQQNKTHAWRTGLRTREHLPYKRGESVGTSKLSAFDVKKMKEMRAAGMSYAKIASHFNVAKSTALFAIKGIRWAHIA